MKSSIRIGAAIAALTLPDLCLADVPACKTHDTTWDSRDVTCAIDANAAATALQFKAEFSGGHDDTMASMTVLLDDKPVACEGGGKLRLMGEDGTVFLHCRLPRSAASIGTLHATIKWSHADYVRAGLSID